jgi:hypothetical protein
MAKCGEFVTAPTGTQYRTGSEQSWQTASVGTDLETNYEARNTQNEDYEIELDEMAMVRFGQVVSVTCNNVSGTVKYRDASQQWHDLESDTTISADSVGTGSGGSVVVECKSGSAYPPPPWS